MRLGQLARKLAVRPTEIAEFLAKESIQQEANSNTRLEDDQVIHIVKRLAPALVENIKADLVKEKLPAIEEEATVTIVEAITPVEIQAPEIVVEREIVIPEAVSLPEIKPTIVPVPVIENILLTDEEVIRAPKVELPGLKVLGKIEIPEPKKKEVQSEAEEVTPGGESPKEETVVPKKEVTPVRERRQPQERRREFKRQDDQRSGRNPIAAQREREAEEARLKREEATKLEKERRTLHYMKKVKVVTPVKINTFIDEPAAEQKRKKEETPTTLWGRFKKWLKS